ncbi:hypothetical protein B0J12DRAFT_292398 [Macrophomina phaseolina]|uniref:Uncharacterized protein n=1 Tax=Macrophomina phaseolina TaxID=35725 RepID=A0ABQ8GNS3_9PEZI|nr:hypothetical protein B0J12DRAFT_292398 [Macrophomina phaseolina]
MAVVRTRQTSTGQPLHIAALVLSVLPPWRMLPLWTRLRAAHRTASSTARSSCHYDLHLRCRVGEEGEKCGGTVFSFASCHAWKRRRDRTTRTSIWGSASASSENRWPGRARGQMRSRRQPGFRIRQREADMGASGVRDGRGPGAMPPSSVHEPAAGA